MNTVYANRGRHYDDRYYYTPVRTYVYQPRYYPVRRATYAYYDPTPAYYGNDQYYSDDYGYDGYGYDNYDNGVNWQGLLLQTVMSAFLGDDAAGLGGLAGIVSPGNDYYAEQEYYQPYNNVYASSGYYNDPYESYAYRPADYHGGGYNSPAYGSDVLNNVYSQGYNEGFVAGQRAREYDQGMSYYNDPYVYENGGYYPYSASLNQNRTYLSEGYQRGYQDALDENGQAYGGQTDLVSVLLSNVLNLS